jgi:hypothetical protein
MTYALFPLSMLGLRPVTWVGEADDESDAWAEVGQRVLMADFLRCAKVVQRSHCRPTPVPGRVTRKGNRWPRK